MQFEELRVVLVGYHFSSKMGESFEVLKVLQSILLEINDFIGQFIG
jgi:hypothetical protein